MFKKAFFNITNHKKPLIFTTLIMALAGVSGLVFSKMKDKPPPICQTFKKPFPHSVCYFDKNNHQLSLVWKKDNQPLFTFGNLKQSLPEQSLIFAMNAGMYDMEFAPIGYTIIHEKEIRSLNLKKGTGNFHLMPNGVFWWDKHGYHVTESKALSKLLNKGKIKPLFATQSGPMLVINGKIHPKFEQDSTSLKMRNGVGIDKNGQVIFIISNTPVNFYQFAELFKHTYQCDNALFLDGGSASALYSTELKRHDKKNMGVMIVATK